MAKNIRIFQIAKDLNISHTEILTFLKKKGVDVASHMTPVDEDIQEMIKGEFRKERQDIDRFRKEQVRREIHQTRIDEEQKTLNKYGSSDSGASLGDILGSVLGKKNNDNA